MMLPVTLALLSALSPAELEARASRRVALEYERIGRALPQRDEALDRAARAIAEEALTTSAARAADVLSLTEAISAAGGWDPSPRALVLRGNPEECLRAFEARTDLAQEPASHVGIGALRRGDLAALAVLLVQRKVDLAPFPRTVRPGGTGRLCGALRGELTGPEVYVTRPDGGVARLGASVGPEGMPCAAIPFPAPGRYTIEVLARGSRGPEVAALFFADTGPSGRAAADGVREEPRTVPEARAAILARINALRRGSGLPPVERDPALERVAQDYADQMTRERFFAHVAPDGSDLSARLSRAGLASTIAGENLGLAGGPLAAHFGIEHSPGHRRLLLEPAYARAGIGVTFDRAEGRDQVRVVEILARPAPSSADPAGDAFRAIAEKRRDKRLAPIERSAALDQIALAHVQRAIGRDEPRTELPGWKIHDRVFAAMDDVATTSVDFFVLDAPAGAADSKNALDPAPQRVGIAALEADSPRFGKGRYWVAVIYARLR